jgi:hypothetical protein
MKWRSRSDSQDPDSAPQEAVGKRVATPPNQRAGAGLSSVCLGETDCFIASNEQ